MTAPIRLYNTLTRTKEPLRTEPDWVTMYVCGPTVYNYAHIGNARPAVELDVLRVCCDTTTPTSSTPAISPTWTIRSTRLCSLSYPEYFLLTMIIAARNPSLMLAVVMVALPGQPQIYATLVIGMLVEFPHLKELRRLLLGARQHCPHLDMSVNASVDTYREEPS
mgnify:CR=1 FL=1